MTKLAPSIAAIIAVLFGFFSLPLPPDAATQITAAILAIIAAFDSVMNIVGWFRKKPQ